MGYAILQKVAYKLPDRNQVRWAFVLSHHEGFSLLFVPRQNDRQGLHAIAVAIESEQGLYEHVSSGVFPLTQDELHGLGRKIEALSEHLARGEFFREFRMDDDWWNE
jgi:hypothetical protein